MRWWRWSEVKLFSLVWLSATPQTVAYQASPSVGFSRQWDGRRSAIMIKSNPIPTRWAVHKLENNYTTEVLPQEWQYWAPCEAPLTGCLATGGRGPRKSGFEGQWSLITEIPQDWGKQKLHSWRAHTRSYMHQDPRNKAGISKESVAEVPILWPPDAKSQCTLTSHSNFPLLLRKIEGSRRGWHWLRWLVSITDSVDMHLNILQVVVEDRGARCAIVHGAVKSRARLSSWTEQHKRLG